MKNKQGFSPVWNLVTFLVVATLSISNAWSTSVQFEAVGSTFISPFGFIGSESENDGDEYSLDIFRPAVAGGATTSLTGYLLELIGLPLSDLTDDMRRWVFYESGLTFKQI